MANLGSVFQAVELLGAGLRVDDADFFAFLEKDAGHAHVGLDAHGIEINEGKASRTARSYS